MPQKYLTRKQWAETYAGFGWQVFPLHRTVNSPNETPVVCSCKDGENCNNKGKHPRTKDGFKSATTDLDQINKWWDKWPVANIGIRCGEGSDLCAVDVDRRNDGDKTMEALIAKYGPPPKEGIVYTGNGVHHLFPFPRNVDHMPKTLGPGIDLQGEGSYIVAAGSRHFSGVQYRWANGSYRATVSDWVRIVVEGEGLDQVDEYPEVDPSKFKEPVTEDFEHAARSLDSARWNVQLAPKGTRNSQLNTEAYGMWGLVARGTLTDKEVWDTLKRAAQIAGLPDSEIDGVLERGRKAGHAKPRPLRSEAREGNEDEKPTVLVRQQLHEMGEESWACLCAPGTNLYQKLRQAVEIIEEPHSHSIQPVKTGGFTMMLDRIIDFKKKVKTKEGDFVEIDASPPERLIKGMLDRSDFPLPRLDTVIYCPTLRPDGSLVDRSGYDRRTRIFLVSNAEFPAIPDSPTREEASEALDVLIDIWCDFPFVEDFHKIAMASAVISLVCRQAIEGPVPLYAFTAGVAGTGKTLLADTVSMVAMGRVNSKQPISTDGTGEEVKKMILSQLRTGAAAILIDNVDATLKSPALDSMLTAWPEYTDRILGQSTAATVSTNTMWMASGNNMRFGGDLHRRVIPVVLQTDEENPELRRGFKHNPLLEHISDNRMSLVAAALTLGRYSMSVKTELVPLGSYEAWSKVARNGLYELTGLDIVEGQKAVREDTQAPVRGVFEALWAIYKAAKFVSNDVLEKVTSFENNDPNVEALKVALDELGVEESGKALGYFLRSKRDRNIGGIVLQKHLRQKRGSSWSMRKLT